MFNQSNVDSNYLELLKSGFESIKSLSLTLAPVLEGLAKKTIKALKKNTEIKEDAEISKLVVETGEDTYNLIPDQLTPGAYKWEKVDLTNQSAGPSNYQAQTIAVSLVKDTSEVEENFQQVEKPALQITVYSEKDGLEEAEIIYKQNNEGKCITNKVRENLSFDEIIEVVDESIVTLLPPNIIKDYSFDEIIEVVDKSIVTLLSPNIIKDYEQRKQLSSNQQDFSNEDIQLMKEDSDLLTTLVEHKELTSASNDTKHIISNDKEESKDIVEESTTTQSKLVVSVEQPNQEIEKVKIKNSFVNAPIESDGFNDSTIYLAPNDLINETVNDIEQTIDNVPSQTEHKVQEQPIIQPKQNLVKKLLEPETDNQEEVSRIPTTKKPFLEVASSLPAEPQAQQWVQQIQLPSKEKENKRTRKERYKKENKEIAKTASTMLTEYGTLEPDGARIYRSDAFVIRQTGDTISLHRRNDEVSEWKNSLMEFTLLKNNSNTQQEPKITKVSPEMLAVERQEFLVVAEFLKNDKKLPDLRSADIRDVANNLGSLAPSGTIRTLEVFKQNNLLSTLSNVLKKADQDKVILGDFTILRSLDESNQNRASLQIFKTTQEKGTQELVRFDRNVEQSGTNIAVTKINISDYDINSINFMAEHAMQLSKEQINQIFNISNDISSAAPQEKGTQEQPEKTAGDILLGVHSYIKEAYPSASQWVSSQSLEDEKLVKEINQLIVNNQERATLAVQGVMHSQIADYKANAALQSENGIDLLPWSVVQEDLLELRGQAISNHYTPSICVTSSPVKEHNKITSVKENLKQVSVKQQVEI